MRKIVMTDLFNAMRVIKKSNLKEELRPLIRMAGMGELNVEDVGIEGIITVIEILSEKHSEQALYEVLAGPFEVKPADVASMPIDILMDKLEELAKENDLKRFFTSLSGLLSKR